MTEHRPLSDLSAVDAYEQVMEKVRLMEMARNRRGAYRTLNYTYGNYLQVLPAEFKTRICNWTSNGKSPPNRRRSLTTSDS